MLLLASTIDLALGVLIIFFLLSLVCSAAVEGLTSWLASRGKMLREGMRELLDHIGHLESVGPDPDKAVDCFIDRPRLKALSRRQKQKSTDNNKLKHLKKRRPPSYLPPRLFADEMVRMLVDQSDDEISKPGSPSTSLTILYEQLSKGGANESLRLMLLDAIRGFDLYDEQQAALALQKFSNLIERRFNDTMDRVAGWYRRHVSKLLLLVAMLITMMANIDSITLMQELSRNDSLRVHLAEVAAQQVESNQEDLTGPTAEPSKRGPEKHNDSAMRSRELMARTRGLELPFGYPDGAWETYFHNDISVFDVIWYLLHKMAGWGVTVLAIMLGGPFWYDLLSKLVSLRTSQRIATAGPITERAMPDDGNDKPSLKILPTQGPALSPIMRDADIELPITMSASDGLPTNYWQIAIDRQSLFDPFNTLIQSGVNSHTQSLYLARLSALVYKTPIVYKHRLAELFGDNHTCTDLQGQSGSGPAQSTQGFVLRKGDIAIVTFRGTEPRAMEDWLVDADLLLQKPRERLYPLAMLGPQARLHRGFSDAFDSVVDQMLEAVGDASRVYVCGHSLGGAIASLAFTHMHFRPCSAIRELSLCTFGAPQVGNVEFSNAVDAAIIQHGKTRAARRYVNDRDIVPRMPPVHFRFKHFGIPFRFDAAGQVKQDLTPGWARSVDLILDASNDPGKWAQGNITDHAIGKYILKLEALTI